MQWMLLGLLLAAPAADTLVVCPAELRPALQPWVEYRTEQGHAIAMIDPSGSAEAIAERIRQRAKQSAARFVVLVGDAPAGTAPLAKTPLAATPVANTPLAAASASPSRPDAAAAGCVPTHLVKAKVNIRWGSEPEIATDGPYGDFDGDGVPEAAVGRLTADTPAELKAMIEKTIAYERSADFGSWRRQVNCVAGVGGFGLLADAVLESSAKYFITQNIPASYRVTMTYGSWRSPYCPDPRLFHTTTLERFNEGSSFWVYIGHGQRYGLDWARMPDQPYPIFLNRDAPKLRSRRGSTVALFLACYIGAFDAADCLGEELLREPGGPVLVLAGSRVTMPYAMSVMAIGLMDEVFAKRCPTLGEAMLRAKQGLLRPAAGGDEQRKMIESIAATISPSRELLAEERAEHVLLFHILGDPLLRLEHPEPVTLDAPSSLAPGKEATIFGRSPVEGRATVELSVPRGRLTFRPPIRRDYPADAAGLAAFQEIYRRANDPCLATATAPVGNGQFVARFTVPPEAEGDYQIDVFVEGQRGCAVGSKAVKIERQ